MKSMPKENLQCRGVNWQNFGIISMTHFGIVLAFDGDKYNGKIE
jgi:hypothetical protein